MPGGGGACAGDHTGTDDTQTLIAADFQARKLLSFTPQLQRQPCVILHAVYDIRRPCSHVHLDLCPPLACGGVASSSTTMVTSTSAMT
jgi:hypothetical protein